MASIPHIPARWQRHSAPEPILQALFPRLLTPKNGFVHANRFRPHPPAYFSRLTSTFALILRPSPSPFASPVIWSPLIVSSKCMVGPFSWGTSSLILFPSMVPTLIALSRSEFGPACPVIFVPSCLRSRKAVESRVSPSRVTTKEPDHLPVASAAAASPAKQIRANRILVICHTTIWSAQMFPRRQKNRRPTPIFWLLQTCYHLPNLVV